MRVLILGGTTYVAMTSVSPVNLSAGRDMPVFGYVCVTGVTV